MDCYCGVELKPNAISGHPACENEFMRRMRDGKCIGCGSKDATELEPWCKECNAIDGPRYVGYPPGGK